MKTERIYFSEDGWERKEERVCDARKVQLVLVFGSTDSLESNDHAALLAKHYPNADIVGCSSAGNVDQDMLAEEEVVATAVEFSKGHVRVAAARMQSETFGSELENLATSLIDDELQHILLLADGMLHNGDFIVQTLSGIEGISPVSGGMAADGNRFDHTVSFVNAKAKSGQLVMVGFYGESLHIQAVKEAGWEEFGAERIVTKSDGNIVYEINHEPALKLYERYLGEYIHELPNSGLLFPFVVREEEGGERLRVLMAVNEDNSLLYAGSVPQGSRVRLCKTSVENLISGAKKAARAIKPYNDKNALCIAISCMARISALKQLVDVELERISETLGEKMCVSGFYSYGEMVPEDVGSSTCNLHNETMSLTVIYEA